MTDDPVEKFASAIRQISSDTQYPIEIKFTQQDDYQRLEVLIAGAPEAVVRVLIDGLPPAALASLAAKLDDRLAARQAEQAEQP
jgi:hypothetical protein